MIVKNLNLPQFNQQASEYQNSNTPSKSYRYPRYLEYFNRMKLFKINNYHNQPKDDSLMMPMVIKNNERQNEFQFNINKKNYQITNTFNHYNKYNTQNTHYLTINSMFGRITQSNYINSFQQALNSNNSSKIYKFSSYQSVSQQKQQNILQQKANNVLNTQTTCKSDANLQKKIKAKQMQYGYAYQDIQHLNNKMRISCQGEVIQFQESTETQECCSNVISQCDGYIFFKEDEQLQTDQYFYCELLKQHIIKYFTYNQIEFIQTPSGGLVVNEYQNQLVKQTAWPTTKHLGLMLLQRANVQDYYFRQMARHISIQQNRYPFIMNYQEILVLVYPQNILLQFSNIQLLELSRVLSHYYHEQQRKMVVYNQSKITAACLFFDVYLILGYANSIIECYVLGQRQNQRIPISAQQTNLKQINSIATGELFDKETGKYIPVCVISSKYSQNILLYQLPDLVLVNLIEIKVSTKIFHVLIPFNNFTDYFIVWTAGSFVQAYLPPKYLICNLIEKPIEELQQYLSEKDNTQVQNVYKYDLQVYQHMTLQENNKLTNKRTKKNMFNDNMLRVKGFQNYQYDLMNNSLYNKFINLSGELEYNEFKNILDEVNVDTAVQQELLEMFEKKQLFDFQLDKRISIENDDENQKCDENQNHDHLIETNNLTSDNNDFKVTQNIYLKSMDSLQLHNLDLVCFVEEAQITPKIEIILNKSTQNDQIDIQIPSIKTHQEYQIFSNFKFDNKQLFNNIESVLNQLNTDNQVQLENSNELNENQKQNELNQFVQQEKDKEQDDAQEQLLLNDIDDIMQNKTKSQEEKYPVENQNVINSVDNGDMQKQDQTNNVQYEQKILDLKHKIQASNNISLTGGQEQESETEVNQRDSQISQSNYDESNNNQLYVKNISQNQDIEEEQRDSLSNNIDTVNDISNIDSNNKDKTPLNRENVKKQSLEAKIIKKFSLEYYKTKQCFNLVQIGNKNQITESVHQDQQEIISNSSQNFQIPQQNKEQKMFQELNSTLEYELAKQIDNDTSKQEKLSNIDRKNYLYKDMQQQVIQQVKQIDNNQNIDVKFADCEIDIGNFLFNNFFTTLLPILETQENQINDSNHLFLKSTYSAMQGLFTDQFFLLYNQPNGPNDNSKDYYLSDIYQNNYLTAFPIKYFIKLFTNEYHKLIPQVFIDLIKQQEKMNPNICLKDLHVYPLYYLWAFYLQHGAKQIYIFYNDKKDHLKLNQKVCKIPFQKFRYPIHNILQKDNNQQFSFLGRFSPSLMLFEVSSYLMLYFYDFQQNLQQYVINRSKIFIKQIKKLSKVNDDQQKEDQRFLQLCISAYYQNALQNELLQSTLKEEETTQLSLFPYKNENQSLMVKIGRNSFCVVFFDETSDLMDQAIKDVYIQNQNQIKQFTQIHVYIVLQCFGYDCSQIFQNNQEDNKYDHNFIDYYQFQTTNQNQIIMEFNPKQKILLDRFPIAFSFLCKFVQYFKKRITIHQLYYYWTQYRYFNPMVDLSYVGYLIIKLFSVTIEEFQKLSHELNIYEYKLLVDNFYFTGLGMIQNNLDMEQIQFLQNYLDCVSLDVFNISKRYDKVQEQEDDFTNEQNDVQVEDEIDNLSESQLNKQFNKLLRSEEFVELLQKYTVIDIPNQLQLLDGEFESEDKQKQQQNNMLYQKLENGQSYADAYEQQLQSIGEKIHKYTQISRLSNIHASKDKLNSQQQKQFLDQIQNVDAENPFLKYKQQLQQIDLSPQNWHSEATKASKMQIKQLQTKQVLRKPDYSLIEKHELYKNKKQTQNNQKKVPFQSFISEK